MDSMSGMLQPVGPEPSMVYWVRRGTVLLIVVTLLLGAWWFLGSRTSAAPGDPASVTQEVTPGADVEGAVAEGGDVASEEAATVSGEPTECADSAIEVTATTDSSTYRVGQQDPVLTLTITNVGDVPCLRDIGSKANELKITSGGYHVWSSDDCATDEQENITLMEPGQQAVSSLTWKSRLSQKGCPDDGKGRKAKAGRYEVVGRNLAVESEGVPFALSNKRD